MAPFRTSEQANDITVFSFEVFARSQPQKLANPDIDPIDFVVFSVSNEKQKA